ncbi:YciI family protein [Massilia sp. TW-1]|uniref:YciI family protein n=1 Tax=Telluria antibiotica TaxID=2717319 RepID=A0ABX0PI78_9BURK|nr:YciI family protein [Telluria antibiotica]NIA57001.1 YciI family protein [Telluria antibiotica]
MFIVTLTYTAPLERIDAYLPAHRAWLEEQYARGLMLMSGRKEPRDGGILIAHAANRAELDAALRDDPFAQAGLATYAVTEFVPTMTAEALSAWRAQ